MALRSILAIYAGDARGSGGLRLSIHMAKKYDAHLTGVVWYGPSPLEHRFHCYINKDILDRHRQLGGFDWRGCWGNGRSS